MQPVGAQLACFSNSLFFFLQYDNQNTEGFVLPL